MADNKIRIEIDPRALSTDDFNAIKGDIIKDIISQELNSEEKNSWHVKVDHDKHAKIVIGVDGSFSPSNFDELSVGERLERIDMVLKDI